MFNRLLLKENAIINDVSMGLSDLWGEPTDWNGMGYLYISSFLPFNHKYFEIYNPNDQAATVAIETYVNGQWVAVDDIIDGTNGFIRSGNIIFTPAETAWELVGDSSDIAELSTTKIYNSYWLRIAIGAASDSALRLSYVGQKFCNDNDLFGKYPLVDSRRLMDAFKKGKQSWSDQCLLASERIAKDLKAKNVILSADQIIDLKTYEEPAVHKTAEIIFHGLGNSYLVNKEAAKKEYYATLNLNKFGVDLNKDGMQSRRESTIQSRTMYRG